MEIWCKRNVISELLSLASFKHCTEIEGQLGSTIRSALGNNDLRRCSWRSLQPSGSTRIRHEDAQSNWDGSKWLRQEEIWLPSKICKQALRYWWRQYQNARISFLRHDLGRTPIDWRSVSWSSEDAGGMSLFLNVKRFLLVFINFGCSCVDIFATLMSNWLSPSKNNLITYKVTFFSPRNILLMEWWLLRRRYDRGEWRGRAPFVSSVLTRLF